MVVDMLASPIIRRYDGWMILLDMYYEYINADEGYISPREYNKSTG